MTEMVCSCSEKRNSKVRPKEEIMIPVYICDDELSVRDKLEHIVSEQIMIQEIVLV